MLEIIDMIKNIFNDKCHLNAHDHIHGVIDTYGAQRQALLHISETSNTGRNHDEANFKISLGLAITYRLLFLLCYSGLYVGMRTNESPS